MKVQVYDGSGWPEIELDDDSTIQNLLNKHGSRVDGGFIPETARFMVGNTVVQTSHVLQDGDRVAFHQPNKIGG